MPGGEGGGTHFEVSMQAAVFAGKLAGFSATGSSIEVLADELASSIHALQLHLRLAPLIWVFRLSGFFGIADTGYSANAYVAVVLRHR